MIYKINSALLSFILITIISCKSQVTLDCKDYLDFYNHLYKKDCFYNKALKSTFYFDLNGNQIEICGNPDKQASIFNNNDSLYNYFVSTNLKWPNCEGVGRVYIALLIDDRGDVMEKRILRNIPGGCNGFVESVFNLVDKFPKWEPAVKKGRTVYSIRIISIKF